MGLFSFVSGAGEKLGGKVFDMLNDDENLDEPTSISQERIDLLRQNNIQKTVAGLGLQTTNFQVDVNGDVVVLSGSVPDQATCEKITLAAGNQHGIASVDCNIEVDSPEPESTLYTVVGGDTLGKISKQFYGSSGKYMKIFEANQPLLEDPNKIYVGQTLRIPTTS